METREQSKYFQKQKCCVWIQPSDLDFKNIDTQRLINKWIGTVINQ